ncbi:hypothetical protein DSCO28_50720 [Desulfosarcina ovata subsp. sediminis]|uniref:Uncharacterized protein n=1 Tax=Desulfosarcina ovata subsp. sediminis TaxID=885957 RepID=A0A5K7ZWF2_9BACT|nr:hypothetical protein DSCO28_50720 [Desulfosarcina ovata subsp. sediminis]
MKVKIISRSGTVDIVRDFRNGRYGVYSNSERELRSLCGASAGIRRSGKSYFVNIDRGQLNELLARIIDE